MQLVSVTATVNVSCQIPAETQKPRYLVSWEGSWGLPKKVLSKSLLPFGLKTNEVKLPQVHLYVFTSHVPVSVPETCTVSFRRCFPFSKFL